ncbi:arf-GAP with coiled-coil, ANK repeat and PH domain-containing protein 3-like [Scleropages formosus]|uniref:Arf-GAP with coiled-coil, ANK repeat and PH domain-containing protein n=1 Tax=Scleropages formosus TaxID=113540 RepID=A0A0N8K1E0_SCLFO|nr:arf-GAP with coiled-coil, ANK repeat and PH domain-containing protein 3-like [Scleropages formosus]
MGSGLRPASCKPDARSDQTDWLLYSLADYLRLRNLFISSCALLFLLQECLDKFGESLQEIVNYHMILFDQAQRSVKQQLHNFVKEDVRKFKETKKQFDKVREDMEMAQVKNAQAPRNKPHEVEEATGTLTITRKCFRHLALDYVLQINVLQAKKKFEILDAMLSFMHAQHTLFQQGYNLLDEIDPYMKRLAAELDQLVIDSAVEKRDMEHKHATIQQRNFLSDEGPAEPLACPTNYDVKFRYQEEGQNMSARATGCAGINSTQVHPFFSVVLMEDFCRWKGEENLLAITKAQYHDRAAVRRTQVAHADGMRTLRRQTSARRRAEQSRAEQSRAAVRCGAVRSGAERSGAESVGITDVCRHAADMVSV